MTVLDNQGHALERYRNYLLLIVRLQIDPGRAPGS